MNKFLEVAKALSAMHIYTIFQAFTYSKNKLNFECSLTSLEKATHRALRVNKLAIFFIIYT